MSYSNGMFHYMLKAEFVTLVSLKVPSGSLKLVLIKPFRRLSLDSRAPFVCPIVPGVQQLPENGICGQ